MTPPTRGRPPTPEPRTERCVLMLTSEQKGWLEAKAERAGLPTGTLAYELFNERCLPKAVRRNGSARR